MADTIRKVTYFKMQASNRPGVGAKLLQMMKESKVNMLAFSGFPEGKGAQLDFIPEDSAAFLRAAKKAKLRLSAKKIGFLIQGKDRVGAVADVLSKLAKAKINVTAIDALSAGGGRWAAILWVKSQNVTKAAKALGAR